MINVFQPSLGKEELDELAIVFQSNFIGKGNYVNDFEQGFAKSLKQNPENFFSTTSCTEGIFLSSDIFSFSNKDEIIVPSISFPAIGNAVLSKGSKLVVCDVDRHSLNTASKYIEEKISKKTKAIFLNHYGGVPCDMDPIIELAQAHNIILIEDAACAPKSFYKGQAIGTFGDMGVWSFDAMKILSTGDGAMIYLKDKEILQAAKEFLYLGLPAKEKSGFDKAANENNIWWEYEINSFGRRAIMNNIAGAIGCVQLKKLEQFIQRRKEIDSMYREGLSGIEWLELPPKIHKNVKSSYYFFWIQLEKRDELAKYLLRNDIYTTFRYFPLNRIPLFGNTDSVLRNTKYCMERTLNLPIHQSLTLEDVQKVIDSIRNFDS